MTTLDQFESRFKASYHVAFRFETILLRSVLVVTDLDDEAAGAFADKARRFLRVIESESRAVDFRAVAGSEYRTVADLLELVEQAAPQLVVTYRNLHSTAWQWPVSLGSHLDVLVQETSAPVLVLPHPEAGRALDHALEDTSCVMAITDNLVGDHRLLNFSAALTEPDGTLWLTHIEDQDTFDKYMDVIEKIPSVDTEEARQEIREKLLKEPRVFVDSCRRVLNEQDLPVTVEGLVMMGSKLDEHRRLIRDHEVDLLVMNTKDQDQLAMRGKAYELAVELREIPLLLL